MIYPSRHLRPVTPRPFVLQARDQQLLVSVHRHRYLLAEHVRQRHFADASLRVAQQRLRRLWEHGYLDRLHLPLNMAGRVTLSPPLYCLARLGAELVGSDIQVDWRKLPHTPRQNAKGYATLLHHMVATDVLIAAECCNTDELSVTTVHETALRQKLATARTLSTWRGQAIMPDAAIQMFPRGNKTALTFYLEVVRAGVRSGNRKLADKLALYARLHHRGYFATVFGHERVRAVLILTTSPERVEHFRQFAAELPHSRNLFWLGAYQPPPPGRLLPVITAEHLRSSMWRTTSGEAISLIPQSPPSTA